ncbi:MAG: methylated-DNA--[protein]-cysteine S-methyltransferase [Microbacteriaceae bacterium]|jgi:methylated-DNA-[protein]-cysteine S-methyltransferase|nr:methylated-DNA--[protein]-cysteine S-methyltransferase [Microbacteriaceae bacterium]HPZ35451.1 methylated-DNA--[protein]-cysteine S-methyltransferase [Microbacteriaceae bacterium]HQC92677.1 methylated-DNA--[protein]-cysteine S-methyltransferase [Microbacteriaceae bacterium]
MQDHAARIERVETPDGPLIVIADAADRVLATGWSTDEEAVVRRIHPSLRPSSWVPAETAGGAAARAYYAGDLAAIDGVAALQRGTALQEAGWAALRGIAPGEPLSYREFAAALGAPSAVRAAASICARNAPALFVPCHRVLRADGTLGGYAWGTDIKRALLAREAAR